MANQDEIKRLYNVRLKSYMNNKEISSHNKEILQRFFRDADLDKFNRPINNRRRLKYIHIFTLLDKWFNHKDLETITTKDFENWYLKIKNDKLFRYDGKPYSENTKATYKVAIKSIWKWLKGGNEVFPEEVKAFKNNWARKEINAISKADVEKIANSFQLLKHAFAVKLLFDSGFRADEFLSMKKQDLIVKTREDGTQYYLAECKVSKTKPRKVSVQLYTDTYTRFLQEYHSGTKPDAPLFPDKYSNLRKVLGVKSRKLLGRNVTPHDLRRASATYFAGVLKSPFQVNKRFGWTMTSSVGNTYIDAAGIGDEEVVEVVEHQKSAELQRRVDLLERELKNLILNSARQRKAGV